MLELKINCQRVVQKISDFLKKEFKKRKKSKAILALSGGVDSTVCAFLFKKTQLDLYGIILPYRRKGIEGKKIAQILNLSKDHIITIDIGSSVDETIKELSKIINLDKIDKGNIMARQRMIIQYALARKLNGLVVGTEDLSEYYLGYFTLHGDQACDIAPISGLFKTQVFQLAKYLGVPKFVLEKKPSPNLWSGQTAEGELGFTYQDADKILYLSFIKKYSKEKILNKGFNPILVNKVLERVKTTEYKRKTPPKILF